MPIDFLQRKKKNPFCPRPLRPTTCSRSCRPLAASLPRPPPLLSSSPVTSPFNLPPPQWCRSSPPVTSSPRPAQGPLRHQQFLQLFSLTHSLSRAASTLYLALRLGTSLTGFHGHQSLEKDFQSTSFVGISLTYQRTNFTQSVCQRRVSKHFRIGSIIAFI